VLLSPPRSPRSEYADGLEHARKAVSLAPNDASGYVILALAEYRLGHFTQSLDASSKSLDLLGHGDPTSGFLAAMASWQKGEKDKASHWYERALDWIGEKNVRNPTARRLGIEAAELLGRPAPALDTEVSQGLKPH
jgi:tetratricopeptide (TPR) repeat protein